MAGTPHEGRERRLSDVIETEAPVQVGRALAIMVAVSRAVGALDPASVPARIEADDVRLREDGSVALDPSVAPRADGDEAEAGASLGRLLFALLVGRRPLHRDDAFEPSLRAELPPSTCALIARSASNAPGQWPSVEQWTDELTHVAGPHAPALPPPERRRVRRRRAVLAAALVVLAVASIVAVWLAPSWWDGATDSEGSLAPVAQVERASS